MDNQTLVPVKLKLLSILVDDIIQLPIMTKHVKQAYNPNLNMKGYDGMCTCAISYAAMGLFNPDVVDEFNHIVAFEKLYALDIKQYNTVYAFKHDSYSYGKYMDDVTSMLNNHADDDFIIRIIELQLKNIRNI